MRRHTVLPSKLEQFSHRFQQGVKDRNKYSQLIGIWYSDFGELNQGIYSTLLFWIGCDCRVPKCSQLCTSWTRTCSKCIENGLNLSFPAFFSLVYHLWHYRSPDERVKIRENSEEDEMWKETSKFWTNFIHTDYTSINSKQFSLEVQ